MDHPDSSSAQQAFRFFPAPDGAEIGIRAGVTFVGTQARTIVNRVSGTRLSGFFSVNPYRGCEHACAYCYARYTHEFLDRKPGEEFERRVYVKLNAPEVFARDLRRARGIAQSQILFGSATDPYQPAEARFRLTQRMLERLLPMKGLNVGIVTKSPLIERDLDLIRELSFRHDLELLISCAFAEEEGRTQRLLEPRAASPARRLQTIARFAEAGVRVSLLCAPLIPGINDGPAPLRSLCRHALEAGADDVSGQVLFLGRATREPFFQWLERHRPDLVDGYRRGYAGGLELRDDWRHIVEKRLLDARMGCGLGGGLHRRREKIPREVTALEELEPPEDGAALSKADAGPDPELNPKPSGDGAVHP